jgi:uncharacterized protein YkwD
LLRQSLEEVRALANPIRRLPRGAALLLALAGLVSLLADGRHVQRTGDVRTAGSDDASDPPAAPAPAPAASPAPSREEVLQAINSHRKRYGLPPLRLNPRLNAAADDRLRDMFERRYFDHVAPDGTSPYLWVTRRGYRYTMVGENLAMGHEDAREVVGEWMGSAHHRANILGDFADIGVAFARGSPTGRGPGYTFVVLYATGSPVRTSTSRARRPGPCPATIAA